MRKNNMKIGISNDHHGIKLKNKIKDYLKGKNIEVIDLGTNEKNNVDYVDYAVQLCNELNKKTFDLGILICGTGIGMSIVANKIKRIRCAKVNNEEEAKLCKEHNMANVIALSEYVDNYKNIIDAFINTPYSIEERHIRRINKIKELE